MISRNLYFQLVVRVILMGLIAMATGYFVIAKGSFLLIFIGVICEIVVIVNLVKYLNSTNRKLSYFLESVQNEDSTLLFPTNEPNLTIRELYQSLTKVNSQIQQLKIESRQQEQYFQLLLENVATGIVTFNSKGFVLHANSAVKKILGIHVLTHINQLERINTKLHQAIRNIKPFEQRLVSFATEKGLIQLSLKSTSFKVKGDELLLLAVQDIRNELDVKELDSWMKLIRVLMHEIMNSIAPITSLSESLCKFYLHDGLPVLPQKVDESMIQTTIKGLNVIREQGNGLMLFVESYRKLTRLSKPDKKRFRMADLLDRMKILYASLENSSEVKLSIAISPPDMELLADENQISQVLLNLLKNALEAAGSNPEGKIRIEAMINKDYLPELKISDNGTGISTEILDQIFVPFFTTRENGSGIGLSISRQIMQLHGGSLQVHSIPGKETCFSMTFIPGF